MSTGLQPLRLATRGSALAVVQSSLIKEALEKAHPGLEVVLKIIRTTGDLLQGTPAGTPAGEKGIFIKEIEEALLRGDADFAVHSCKDLPVEMTPGLRPAAVPRRESPADVLLCKAGAGAESWPEGGVVATGSLRRGCQWKERHAGAVTVPVRGNIDTRVRKLRENSEWHGLILAEAGLNRLSLNLEGLDRHRLPYSWMLPAPGQGALLLQSREDDDATAGLLDVLQDVETSWAIRAERAVLAGLGGGCMEAMGALACREGTAWKLESVWYPGTQGAPVRASLVVEGSPNAESAGILLAERLQAKAQKA
jgi:hydroxymethylbilane synthase